MLSPNKTNISPKTAKNQNKYIGPIYAEYVKHYFPAIKNRYKTNL